jgi:hypothetical protein
MVRLTTLTGYLALNGWVVVNWKEAAVTSFKVLFQNFPEWTENNKNTQSWHPVLKMSTSQRHGKSIAA